MKIRMAMLAAAFVAFATACGDDDSTGPGDVAGVGSGSMKFSYSGDLAGTFSASGEPEWDDKTGAPKGSFAAAGIDTDTDQLIIMAFQATKHPQGHVTMIFVEGTNKGRYDFGFECEINCASMLYFHNADSSGGKADGGIMIGLDSGHIDLSEVTSKRVKGAFSGTAVGMSFSGQGQEVEELEVEIRSGNFDVPIIEELDLDYDLSVGTDLPALRIDPAKIEGFDKLSPERQAKLLRALDKQGMLR